MPRLLPVFVVLLVAPALAGCWHEDDAGDPRPTPGTPTPGTPAPEPRLTFGGVVVDALTGAPLPDAAVRLDLAHTQPCRREGIVWNAYSIPVAPDGTYGPLELPTPRSDDVAFFLHVTAPGHGENVTFIGPAEARAGIRNMTVVLHPDAALEGRAPPGTLVALETDGWPRFALADASGAFRFDAARAVEAAWVANTEPPALGRVTPPASLDVQAPNGSTWRLEGSVLDARGAPVPADVVAWNGSRLAGVARSGATGVFVLPLAAHRQDLLLEARTPDGALGGVLRVLVEGPPATRHSLSLAARC